MVGRFKLHKNVAILCAGNLESDGAIVEEMSTALQSRLIHFELIVDSHGWCDWAMNFGIDHRITDFIKFKPCNLYTFSTQHTDRTYAAPRTWEFANRVLPSDDEVDNDLLIILAGTISEGVAREFITFLKVYSTLPRMVDIISSPNTVKVPTEPGTLYALTGAIAHNIQTNTEKIMMYLARLPIEFQVVTLREVMRRNAEFISNPSIQNWLNINKNQLF